ncbi:MAG: DUF2157 domain-containing protein [Deltaproteobacteria bacterium]|nr:MAG: DUF2157 domain-containing protein [Deltaproteobacteria bacterium]TMB28911.1 MAG: DUF2157 domain-containing protein [Deltaproteobacteria bacterium]
MQIEREDLDEAVRQRIVDPQQAAELWTFLGERERGPSHGRFNGINVAYYLGALIVVAAMGWLMNLGWESFGGAGIFIISALYAVCFVFAGRTLYATSETRIPGGLLYTVAVCMTPLVVYGLERWTGVWMDADPGNYRGFFPWIKGGWFAMEAATVLAGLFALRKVKFPFLVAPIAFVLWFMSMDVLPALFHASPWNGDLMRQVSIVFGLAMLFIAFQVDHRTEEDYAFWLYLFGMTAFWGAITSMDSHSELARFGYCALNAGFIVASVLLRRRVLLVFGSIGVNLYLGHLAFVVFEHSKLFPFVLTLLGLSIIASAVGYQRNRDRIDGRVASWIPEWLVALLPPARA